MDKRSSWKPIAIIGSVLILFLAVVFFQTYKAATAPDTHCSTTHIARSYPPASLTKAMDYFIQENYDYDRGNCKRAIADYTKSIVLNSDYPQAYNNRAYTFMRMQDYQDALPDLDKAILLNPNYIQALMNRGDIYNYAIDKQRAIVDYEKLFHLAAYKEQVFVDIFC